jgi:hypothetical protein
MKTRIVSFIILISTMLYGCFLDPENPDSPDTRLVGSWQYLTMEDAADADHSKITHIIQYIFGYSGDGARYEERFDYLLSTGEKHSILNEHPILKWKVENNLLLLSSDNGTTWTSHEYYIISVATDTYHGNALYIDGLMYILFT